MSTMAFLSIYLAILTFHFAYAVYLMRSGKDLLIEKTPVGELRQPVAILGLLLLINGIGMTVVLTPTLMWITLHSLFHALLAVDELKRLRTAPHRWPFLLDHLLLGVLIRFGAQAKFP